MVNPALHILFPSIRYGYMDYVADAKNGMWR